GYDNLRESQTTIRSGLISEVNRTWPVYQGGAFNGKSFFRWCRKTGIDWPHKVSEATGEPYQPLDDETWRDMEGRDAFIQQLRQVRKTLTQINKRSLVVDPVTRRHYFATSVFRSVTGRNQPRNFIFCGPKWMRFLILSESPEHVLVYVDFVAQEVGLAAGLAGDPVMRAIYEADDCHMAFAIRAGAAPAGATKRTHPDVRKQYKTVNLGVLYGQTAFGIAPRLGISFPEAEKLLDDHHALFPVFWRWSERTVQGAFDRGWIATPCGWRSRVPFPSNERTWRNFCVQGAGADVMRLTVTYMDRQGVRILAPIHDGFLLSCRRDQLADLRAAVDY